MKVLRFIEPLDAAYLAGLFDGEGCVLIYARKTYVPRGQTTPHHLLITITNTHQPVLEWVQKTFGGHLYAYKRATAGRPKMSRAWKWTATSREAAHLLRAMLPYLKIKHTQAMIALELQDDISSYKSEIRGPGRGRAGIPALPPERLAYRESLRLRLLETRAAGLQKFH